MFLDKIINTIYSFAAAIVVFGAWAKLENKEFSSTALTAGLLAETGIFCLYGLLEWRKSHPGEESPGVANPEERPVSVQGKESVPEAGRGTTRAETEELTATMRQTNRILQKVFRTD